MYYTAQVMRKYTFFCNYSAKHSNQSVNGLVFFVMLIFDGGPVCMNDRVISGLSIKILYCIGSILHTPR